MKMRTSLIICFSLFWSFIGVIAQISNPVTWEVTSKKVDDTSFEVIYKAQIEKGWHLYSQNIEGDDGPIPTEIMVSGVGVQSEGLAEEPKGVEAFDKTFQMNIKYFENEVTFKKLVKITQDYKDPLKASVFFMVCDDEKCLPPEEKEFELNLLKPAKAKVVNKACTALDIEKSNDLILDIDLNGYEISEFEKKSLWTIFFLGFIGGLIALLTPCVFPMIPLTVSFFSHSSGSNGQAVFKAVLYGFFILIVYLLVSVPFHILDSANPDMLNNVSTNTWLNMVFFVVFIVFAISFFGYFEITLPSKWSNAMDSKATQLGGVLGVFFMALTLALVSFSCTGPILGSLLGGSLSNDGGAIQLTYGLAGFGLALALPFAFFALFPNLLKKLPKSGGWMSTVKAVLGFVELAFALKFLSNADLVEHWGILKREIFIGIWIVIALGLAAYLFGVFKFPHDAPNQKISKGRKVTGIITLLFVAYLVPGLLPGKGSLKLLSGFPPPNYYSIYENNTAAIDAKVFKDFNQGLEASEKSGKPMLIDFTGWACVNCRKMEENVWVVDEIKSILENDVVIVSLYVDDRKLLTDNDQFTFCYPDSELTKSIKTVGDKWSAFQTVNFKNNSQPYYVLMTSNYKLLNTPIGNTPNYVTYLNWLKLGLKK